MTATRSRPIAPSPFVVAISRGETRRELLEPLLRDDLEALEGQYRPRRGRWAHCDPDAPLPDVGRLAIFAALMDDEALWRRIVEHAVSLDLFHMKMQKWSGVDEEDLGPYPTMERFAPRVRWQVNQILSDVPAGACPVAAVLDRWEAKVEAEAQAERARARTGQQLREPDNVRSFDPKRHPDLLPEYDRLMAELRRRLALDPRRAGFLEKGFLLWDRTEHPDLAEAFDRLHDECDRREGRRKPDLRVKVGDKVFANGKLWTVRRIDERTGTVHLHWSDGSSSAGIPVDGDGLEPER